MTAILSVQSTASLRVWLAVAATALATALCQSGAAAPPKAHPGAPGQVGLGKVLTTKDGGQIYGFDINQNGDDGVLASAQNAGGNNYLVSVETFDQNTGKITKSFKKETGPRDSYSVDGIFAGDVALVTHFIVPDGSFFAKRRYAVMNPVTAQKFTGDWTPPVKDIDVLQSGVNQDTQTAVLFAIELKKQDDPILVVSDVAANTFTMSYISIPISSAWATGQSFRNTHRPTRPCWRFRRTAARSSEGARQCDRRSEHRQNETVHRLQQRRVSRRLCERSGRGSEHRHRCDDDRTELAGGILRHGQAQALTFAQLPCTNNTDQTNSGSNIAVDPVNKLFLVTDYFYCDGSQGSAIVVYDEGGNFVETITGFHFAIGEPAPVLNPASAWAGRSAAPPVSASCSSFSTDGNCGRSATPELIRRVVSGGPRLVPGPDCGCPTAWRRSAPEAAVEIGNIPKAKCERDLADAANVTA